MLRITTLVAGLALSASAFALSLSDLTQSDASAGLKDALSQGAKVAELDKSATSGQEIVGYITGAIGANAA